MSTTSAGTSYDSPGTAYHAVIVHPQLLFAEAILRILEARNVRALVAAVPAAVSITARVRPQITVLGVRSAADVALGRQLLSVSPSTAIIAVTGGEGGVIALRQPFRAVISEDTSLAVLWRQLERALTLWNASANGAVAATTEASLRTGAPSSLARELTAREWDVLDLLVEGSSSAEIGARLGIRPNTVRSHVQHILQKLQAHSRLAAAAFVVRHGLHRPG